MIREKIKAEITKEFDDLKQKLEHFKKILIKDYEDK